MVVVLVVVVAVVVMMMMMLFQAVSRDFEWLINHWIVMSVSGYEKNKI